MSKGGTAKSKNTEQVRAEASFTLFTQNNSEKKVEKVQNKRIRTREDFTVRKKF